MYIEPNSVIKLCNNVPLDNTYKHSIYFASLSAQTTYFNGKAKVVLQNQSYQRVVKGKMRVQCCADDIYDCNYMAFNNTNFGTKWFYAFITGIEYVNNVTSEITFEIDSLQTYFFDTELKACYVEREHSATDVIGENVVPEDIGTPELCVMNTWTRYWGVNDRTWKVIIQIQPSLLGSMITGGDDSVVNFGNGQFYPCTYEVNANASECTNIGAFLKGRSTIDKICGAYMVPSEFGETIAPIQINDLAQNGVSRPTSYYNYNGSTLPQASYTPKNKKLFTYPYTKLTVANSNGDSTDFKWELGRGGTITFNLIYNHLNTPSCELRPTNYYWNASSRFNTLPITNFPLVTLTEYPEYAFENIFNSVTRCANQMAMTGISDIPFTVAREFLPILNDKGSGKFGTSNGNLDLKYNSFGYIFYQMGIRAQDAEVIDNYFSMFGYATKKIKVPNRNVRPHWCYTKTRDCVVQANAPADDVRKICQIYDNGITFWKNPSEVGNYSLNNSIS